MSRRITIIGAGMAGLTAARALAAAGHDVVVLDRGRGPGGRTSRRHGGGYEFDHGAQYFTVRDPRFQDQVDAWIAAGLVAPWTPRLVAIGNDGHEPAGASSERLVGVPGMNAMAKDLARGLEVRHQVTVATARHDGAVWRLASRDGQMLAEADALLVTVPPAQAAPLLAEAPELAAAVMAVTMHPCWAVMLGFAAPLPVPFDGAFVNVGPLAWIARNSSKPGRGGGEAWVLHAASGWSDDHLDDDPGAVIDALDAAFRDLAPADSWPSPIHGDARCWRSALPAAALPDLCRVDQARGVAVAGDWCGGPRIEGAYLSGLAAAAQLGG
jgi:predicted NAD/FAD-dependent oxidoreductase